MVTIHTSEFWINEPIDFVLDKIRRETRLVKFGPFNAFDTEHKNFNTHWIGEIDNKKKKFKLFRVTGKTHTSDLSVHGEFVTRINKPMIQVKYKVHFTAFLGLFGVLVCGYAFWFLLREKGVPLNEIVLVAFLLTTGAIYSISTIRDLNKSEQLIQSTIYRIVKTVIEEADDDEEAEDEDA